MLSILTWSIPLPYIDPYDLILCTDSNNIHTLPLVEVIQDADNPSNTVFKN